MNVEKEFAAVNRRFQAQINASAREALIRIGGHVEAEVRAQEVAPIVIGAEALGQAWRSLVDGMAAFSAAFNRGYGAP